MSAPESPLDDSSDILSPPLPNSTDESLSTPSDSLPPPSPALEPPPATESESLAPPPPSPIEPPPADSPHPPSQPQPSDTFIPKDNKEEPPEEDPPSPPTPSEPPPSPTSFEQDPTDPPPPPDESDQGSDNSRPSSTASEQQQQADPPPPPNAPDEQQSADPPPPPAPLKGRPSDEQQSVDPLPPSNSSSKEKKEKKEKKQQQDTPVTPPGSFEPPPGDSESPPTSDTSPPFNSALPPTPSVRSKDDSSSVQPPSSLPSADSPFSNQNSTLAPRSSSSQSPPSLTPSRPAAEQNGSQLLAPPPPPGQTRPDPAFLQLGVIVIVLGGILILALFGLCLICCSRKKIKKDPYGTEGYYMQQPHPGKVGNRSSSQMQYYQHGPPSAEQYQMAKLSPRSSMGSRRGNSTLHKNYSDKSFNPSSMGLNLSLSTTAFSYEELAMATNGFSSENFLGQGGFGYVHKGILPNGKEVAVKSLKADSGQGDREFQVEIDVISRVHHKHLVCLVGYCVTDNQRMLVYEFIGNGTLEFHLHGKGRTTMDWSTRMKIALGSAKGLAYLHEDCHPKIIHRDIKGANILIDLDYEAKVADFGLAKLTTDNNTHVSTRVMGTFGYLAPEYASTGKLSEKSDVFSFGVMLLELITGRRPVNRKDTEDSLVDWARPLLAKALEDGNLDPLVDPKLGNNYNMHEMASMVACAAGAVSHSFKRRPRMSQIVRALDESSSFTDLNGGDIPGQTKIFGSPEYTSGQYKEDMKKFKQMIIDSQGSSEHTAGGETTSEYSVTSDSTTVESQTSPQTDGRR